MQIAFPQANELATGADVRIAGVDVGKVVDLTGRPDRQPHAGDARAPAPVRADPERYARDAPDQDAARARPTSSSARATARAGALADGGRLPDAQVAKTVDLDQILATFDPTTRAAFQTWMQSQALAVAGVGQDINEAFGSLPQFVDSGQRLLGTLRFPVGCAARRRLKYWGVL